jgi:myo-inositol-1(or 4)-monophosphatase
MDYKGLLVQALKKGKDAFRLGKHKPIGYGAYGDLSYDTDKIIEDSIARFILSNIDAKIVTEESGLLGNKDAKVTVLLDPLDGSTNATKGIPIYCAAAAIANGDKFKDIVSSVVMNFVSESIITCEKEKGVFINGKRCKVSSRRELSKAVVCLDVKTDKRFLFNKVKLANLINKIKYPRVLGAAALEIAFVACGITDAYVEARRNLRAFDCLPSIFMVKEAGGFVKVFGEDLDNFNLSSKRRLAFIAANSEDLAREILSCLGEEV